MRHAPLSIRLLATSAAAISLAVPGVAMAQTDTAAEGQATDDDLHTPDADLVVTAPFVRSLDLFGNVGVVEGDTLARDLRSQIGETLTALPGVSATSFTPGASRPVVRGFQYAGADRAMLTPEIADVLDSPDLEAVNGLSPRGRARDRVGPADGGRDA